MSYDYVECKRSLEYQFGSSILAKIKSRQYLASEESLNEKTNSGVQICLCQRELISIEEAPNINTTLRSVATAQSYGTKQGFPARVTNRLGKGEGSTAIGKHFNLGESTVRAIKKNEAAIRKSVTSGTKLSTNFASYIMDVLLERTERAIAIWIEEQVQRRIPVSGYLIQEKALQFYKSMKKSEPSTSTSQAGKYFSASEGWLTGFLKRNALHNIKITGESATADEGAAKIFAEELAKIIEDGDYSADQVFNTDQTGLYWKKLPNITSQRMKKLQVDIKQVKIESPYYFVAMHQEIGC
ncbi:tigger transposable element-derived protein 1 [Trichonephila clavipes]|nr:tigger transposable element-derived protein 1 [Trichonephila clavipes]